MTYDGDVLLYPTADGGDINIANGQPDMDQGLWTAVFISLFSGDWWGNAIATADEQLDDGLDSIDGTLNAALLRKIEIRAKALLQWLIDDGAVKAVDVSATIPTSTRVDLTVTLTQPDGTTTSNPYTLNWASLNERFSG